MNMKNSHFQTSDYTLAVSLCCLGFPVDSLDCTNPQRVEFCFWTRRGAWWSGESILETGNPGGTDDLYDTLETFEIPPIWCPKKMKLPDQAVREFQEIFLRVHGKNLRKMKHVKKRKTLWIFVFSFWKIMEHIGDILQNSKWQQLSDQRKKATVKSGNNASGRSWSIGYF